MKKILILLFISTIILSCFGCGRSVQFVIKDYKIEQISHTSVGNPMLSWAIGTRTQSTKFKDTVVVFRSGDQIKGAEGTFKELVYKGVLDNNVKILYREYSMSDLFFPNSLVITAKPIFFLDLAYDLSKENTIAFQDFIIRIESADQQQIEYTVIGEPLNMDERKLKQQFK